MADTPRSLAALLALLADNTTGQISPQDIRDMLVSLPNATGSVCISVPALTTPAAVNTPIKMLGTYVLTSSSLDFDMDVQGSLRYLGVTAKLFQVCLSVSLTAAGNNKDIAISVGKNGVSVLFSSMSRRHTTAIDIGTISTTITLPLSLNDTLEIFVENKTDATGMTGETAVLSAMGGIL